MAQRELKPDPDTVTSYQESHFVPPGVSWVHAMQACRRIREVALGSGALWAAINLEHKNTSWVNLSLARAGIRKHLLRLDSRIGLAHLGIKEGFPLLFRRSEAARLRIPNSSRDYEIFRDEYDREIEDFMTSCLSRPQPQLTFLEFYNQAQYRRWYDLRLEGRFLGGGPIRLTHLLLEKLSFNGRVPHMPVLRRLILIQVQNDLSCRALLALLNQTPNLTSLHLDRPCDHTQPTKQFPFTIPDIQQATSVSLLHLNYLSLVGDLAQISQIVQVLPQPFQKMDMELEVLGTANGYFNTDDFTRQLPFLSERICAVVAQHLISIAHPNLTVSAALEASESDRNVKVIVLSLKQLVHNVHADHRGMTNMELYVPVGANINNILRSADHVEIFVRNSISDFNSELMQNSIIYQFRHQQS